MQRAGFTEIYALRAMSTENSEFCNRETFNSTVAKTTPSELPALVAEVLTADRLWQPAAAC